MVRFEKLLWENALNIKALGRERIIGAPVKWYRRNVFDDMVIASQKLFDNGIRSYFYRLIEPITAYFFWKWPRDIALQRGLSMEDFILHTDRDQRREVLFETVNRESCHPYQHLFFKKRRARYYKVERALRGFYVPDYIRKEGEERLAADTFEVMQEWQGHLYENYYSDMTPATRYTAMHRLIPLEVFNLYGLLRAEAWDRYFMNEVDLDEYTSQDDKWADDPFRKYNLDTEEGKRSFEAEVNRYIDLYPGTVVRDGEQFNFKEYYARNAIVEGKDLSKFDPEFVEDVEEQMLVEALNVNSKNFPEEKVGKSTLGTEFPARLKSKYRKVLM
jgi:hypothetical protein